MKRAIIYMHLSNFLFAIGEALQLPSSLDPLHLHLERVGGETLPVLVDLHLPPKVLNCPGKAEVGVLLGASVTPGSCLHWRFLNLASRAGSFGASAEKIIEVFNLKLKRGNQRLK